MIPKFDVAGHLAFDWLIHLTRKVSAPKCKKQFFLEICPFGF